ncbi:class 1 fructose-bisphosphatase [Natrialbaceae archaeon A-CW2]|uniref:class 1 fructose-bisphosphatase n=1 Tax=Natronosalvus amylolyticus TaxID=2961994 RepID=UPI0020C9CBB1|nr:class 1 fructose-bisphosphatase [Natronosalvus amylolyticus]
MGASAARRSDAIESIVNVIARSAAEIRQGLVGRRGAVEAENPSGEVQMEADVWADGILRRRLSAIDGVAQYASEEEPDVFECGDIEEGFAVAVDPLDGSSNLQSNNTMGTIFGVYDQPLPAPGRSLVTAGFVLYGPIITMAVATEEGVSEYELSGGERTLITDDLTLPGDPVVFGFGGRAQHWPPAIESYVETIRTELKLRYGGAMIGDVNQVLSYGGIFAYPTLETHENGKLRLQFEGNPIGYVLEQAGGRSSDGTQSLLDVEATELHQRTPVYIGSTEYVDRLEATLE